MQTGSEHMDFLFWITIDLHVEGNVYIWQSDENEYILSPSLIWAPLYLSTSGLRGLNVRDRTLSPLIQHGILAERWP